MKRDVDLMRAILAFVEEHCPPEGTLRDPVEIPGYDQATIRAHTELLIEGGYIDGHVLHAMAGSECGVNKLTNAGHDAIAAIKNDTVWNRVKQGVVQHGIALTFTLAVTAAKAEMKKLLGLP